MRSIIPWKRGKNQKNSMNPNMLLSGIWDDEWGFSLPALTHSFGKKQPAVDLSEDKESYTVRAELPGMSEKDIHITWLDGVLTIKGEKREEKEERKKGLFHQECSYGYFSRSIPLDNKVLWEKSSASYKKGILMIKMPKAEISKETVKIPIQS